MFRHAVDPPVHPIRRVPAAVGLSLLLLLLTHCTPSTDAPAESTPPPQPPPPVVRWTAAASDSLAALIETERAAFDIPALSVALVSGSDTVHAAAFGLARENTPASAETAYFVGWPAVPRGTADSARRAVGHRWSRHQRTVDIPPPGPDSAATEFASVLDLARLALSLFDEPDGGLGFAASRVDTLDLLSRDGGNHGHTARLVLLPERRLAVAAAASLGDATGPVPRIAAYGLDLLLALQNARPLPARPRSAPVDPGLARRLDGRYVHDGAIADLVERYGRLRLAYDTPGVELAARGDTLVARGLLASSALVVPAENGVRIDGRLFTRANARPAPAPDRWQGLVGEYGPDDDVRYILERGGRLWMQERWAAWRSLHEAGPDSFLLAGLDQTTLVAFDRAGSERASALRVGDETFERRRVAPGDGATFAIRPLLPLDTLRARARAAEPPVQEGDFREIELVDVAALDPSIRLDVRYATTDNFMRAAFYDRARVYLQRPAAEAVVAAHRALAADGLGLVLHDGYRPWAVTKMFWDATPGYQKVFVADPARGSRHNRGAAIDLSLFDRATGEPIEMVSGYDEFSVRAHPDYPATTDRRRWLRERLRDVMEAHGFSIFSFEWWHFDHHTWRQYPIANVPFGEIGRTQGGG